MKIRVGYVSNSSTSSFVIVGVCIRYDEWKKMFDWASNIDDDNLLDVVEEKDWWKFGLNIESGLSDYSEDDRLIGFCIEKMKDDETLLQFKREVFEALKKIGFNGKLEDVKIIRDAGYNG